MSINALKNKALSLPMEPGVYIMRDKDERVIYVGKAKKLKNRVTQYFQESASHSAKTKIMVSKVASFDVIVAGSEFEALVLECSLIKQHMPQYNILLKDDKGYPYIRLDTKEQCPKLTLVNKPQNDHATYFGPFGGRAVSQNVIQTIRTVFKLPTCNKKFPKDIGKGRPCLNYHMGQCEGWCRTECTESYKHRIEQVKSLLNGNYKKISNDIQAQMHQAAEELNFELAATLRDRLNAIEALGQKQLVTAGKIADIDVIGFYATETKAGFSVLHFSGGNLLDKDFEIISSPDDAQSCVNSLVKQYYINRGFLPKQIILPFNIEDQNLLVRLLEEKFGRSPKFIVPQKGDKQKLRDLANKNAQEEVLRVTTKDERLRGSLELLGKTLSMNAPLRIESYDISNISGTDIVAAMVVFENGKPSKKNYKRFKINGLQDQDDYYSMYQTIKRRFQHFIDHDEGFIDAPDLLLIDGGAQHAAKACQALQELNLRFPVLGMVKDDRHRTRSLISMYGDEIDISHHPSVFSLIGEIQEETHRFAISYHRKLRSKRLKASALDKISGIGQSRKEILLRNFKSIKAIKMARLDELEQFLPKDAAYNVYQYFNQEEA